MDDNKVKRPNFIIRFFICLFRNIVSFLKFASGPFIFMGGIISLVYAMVEEDFTLLIIYGITLLIGKTIVDTYEWRSNDERQ